MPRPTVDIGATPPRGLLLLIVLALLAGGCAGSRAGDSTDITIAPGQYAAAFNAAREELIRLGFDLQRVDARHGIITTRAKQTAGIASPWDREQTTAMQEVEDLLNRHLRSAIITFRALGEPEHAPPHPQVSPGPPPADLREVDGPILARVEVVLERQRRPGWRLEPTSLRFSQHAVNPDYYATGMMPSYNVAFSRDQRLAQRIAAKIRRSAAQ